MADSELQAVPVLVVGTGAEAVAASRFPRALARARAEVSLLCPSDSLARHTRHAARIGVVAPDAPATRWVEALFALIDVAAPRAIVPVDAGALALVVGLAASPPPALRPARVAALADLVVASLGPLDKVAASVDPSRRAALLREAGVDLVDDRAAGDGMRCTHHVATHRGRVVAAATAEHVVVDPAQRNRPTVLRFFAHDGVAALAARAVAALEASGCLALDVVVDGDGRPALAGLDRHVVASMHVSQWLGVDLAAAWIAALDGQACAGATSLAPGTSRHSVAFPQEWHRDRASAWLREQRVDVPWDDPDLLDAILADAMVPRTD